MGFGWTEDTTRKSKYYGKHSYGKQGFHGFSIIYKVSVNVGYHVTEIYFNAFQLAVKSRAMDVAAGINQVYDAILHS